MPQCLFPPVPESLKSSMIVCGLYLEVAMRKNAPSGGGGRSSLIIAKNDLERHVHTLSGDAGADLRSQAGGATRTPTPPRRSPPLTCTIPLPNHRLPSR